MRIPTYAADGFHVPTESQARGRNDQPADGFAIEINLSDE